MGKKPDEEYTPEETAKRADEALRRALNTQPKPHEALKKKPRETSKKAGENKLRAQGG